MPVTERYQVDVFAIIVLIASILIVVFLIVASVYYVNLMNLKPPTQGEATFLFWTTIVLAIIFLFIAIYAIYRIFTYKVTIYEPEPVVTPVAPVIIPAPVITVQPQPVISTVPVTTLPTDLSTSFSSVPVTQEQRVALNQQLLTLGNVVGGA